MSPRALLDDLRHGRRPGDAELAAFITGLGNGNVSDAQAGAFAMAVCLHGLGEAGRVALTRAMTDSGARLEWDLPGPVVDKHSTGGVGDCVSLVLAPALAACGAFVPMISGRGLGHTGGTLDKLEAIPGFDVELPTDRMRQVVGDAGCAIVAANTDIAPADRRLYAVRDATATVDQIDLITASILSKKLAAGLERLVLDVKVGAGAFMPDLAAAQALANALVGTANGAGCPCTALISDMNQPVARAIGNAVELAEVMGVLTGATQTGRLFEISIALAAELLGGADPLRDAIQSGHAAERFGAMVTAQGGPTDFVENWRRYLPRAPVQRRVAAPTGRLCGIDGTALGHAVIALGGGRLQAGAAIDPAVGFSDLPALGTRFDTGATLAVIHARTEADADAAQAALLGAISLGDTPAPPLIHQHVAQ